MKLNLGCGKDIKQGYTNLDIHRYDGVDVVHDLEQFPYPFEDNTFDEVYAQHILEHINDLQGALKELIRITKPGGTLKVIAPYFSGHGAFNDPTHVRFFTYKTFDYLQNWLPLTLKNKKLRFFSAPFMKSKGLGLIADPLLNLAPILYQRFFCWILPSSEIHFYLEVEK